MMFDLTHVDSGAVAMVDKRKNEKICFRKKDDVLNQLAPCFLERIDTLTDFRQWPGVDQLMNMPQTRNLERLCQESGRDVHSLCVDA